MKFKEHRLIGERITFCESPNHGGLFGAALPDTIVIHYTAGSSAKSSVNRLCDPRSKSSAHLVIGRDGSITQLLPYNIIAWHSGRSSYGGRVSFNRYSIGIEIDNAGRLTKTGRVFLSWFGKTYREEEVIEAVHRNESSPAYWHRYTEEQISLVFEICADLVDQYEISSILGHEEISPHRKTDPGPAFPLERLREQILQRNLGEDGPQDSLAMDVPGLVTARRLNVRSSPSLGAPTVASPLSKGTIVNLLRESNGWYKVQVKTQGWVKKEFIKT